MQGCWFYIPLSYQVLVFLSNIYLFLSIYIYFYINFGEINKWIWNQLKQADLMTPNAYALEELKERLCCVSVRDIPQINIKNE